MAGVHCRNKILDYLDHFGNDWVSYTQIKIKGNGLSIFLNKKILIYGLGKSGLSAFKFLKGKSDIFLYDDDQTSVKSLNIKKNLIS